jgi:hypothetical protein
LLLPFLKKSKGRHQLVKMIDRHAAAARARKAAALMAAMFSA